jgi:hypothetical protein
MFMFARQLTAPGRVKVDNHQLVAGLFELSIKVSLRESERENDDVIQLRHAKFHFV